MSFWAKASAGPDQRGEAADERQQVDARRADREALEEDRVEAGDQEHAGHDHGGGVDQRRDRRRAGHGVGQPRVQRELARLRAHRGGQRDGRHQQHQVAHAALGGQRVDLEDVEGLAGAEEQDDHADDQADVAHAVGQERLEGGVGVRLLLPPVPDEHERAEADQLPGERAACSVFWAMTRVSIDAVNRRQEGEVVGEAPVALQVLGAVDVDQQRDQGDGEEHHHRQAVDHGADVELLAPELEPRRRSSPRARWRGGTPAAMRLIEARGVLARPRRRRRRRRR